MPDITKLHARCSAMPSVDTAVNYFIALLHCRSTEHHRICRFSTEEMLKILELCPIAWDELNLSIITTRLKTLGITLSIDANGGELSYSSTKSRLETKYTELTELLATRWKNDEKFIALQDFVISKLHNVDKPWANCSVTIPDEEILSILGDSYDRNAIQDTFATTPIHAQFKAHPPKKSWTFTISSFLFD